MADRAAAGTARAARAATRHRAGGPVVRVTLVHSAIGHNPGTRGTLRALGLHRLHQTIEVADTPATRGMLRRVAFLVTVESVADGDQPGTKGRAT